MDHTFRKEIRKRNQVKDGQCGRVSDIKRSESANNSPAFIGFSRLFVNRRCRISPPSSLLHTTQDVNLYFSVGYSFFTYFHTYHGFSFISIIKFPFLTLRFNNT